jgi:hypothetical protein
MKVADSVNSNKWKTSEYLKLFSVPSIVIESVWKKFIAENI